MHKLIDSVCICMCLVGEVQILLKFSKLSPDGAKGEES